MPRWLFVGVTLLSWFAAYVQFNAVYIISTNRMAALGAGAFQKAAMEGIIPLIGIGLLLIFWPLYVMSQERRWKKG